jgi:NAD(P)-dependent dehydrogenase (short-subunit alcohol dehydrogenase family)
MAPLSDTRVLVTGGTSGLGRAMAGALVRAGARVALTSRDRERAEAAAAELGAGTLASSSMSASPRPADRCPRVRGLARDALTPAVSLTRAG